MYLREDRLGYILLSILIKYEVFMKLHNYCSLFDFYNS